ncbi:MAG: hypothetical protein HXX80_00860 [Nitrososphaerales archaeon]|nr:hypothetical protein [Nitrososphaerales archaeon]
MNGSKGGVNKLKEIEKNLIFEALRGVIKDRETLAISAYGSRIAGYAREDSDYDIIVALSKYRPRIKYRYIRGGLDLAALIVDGKSLMKDAEEASLGEFVAGRLLNVYEALLGNEFIGEVERKLKGRVTLEIIDEIVLGYGNMSTNFIIPVKYLLFEKLKKRAALYPPALYSYVKTYRGEHGEENLRAALGGFLESLKEMERQGWVSLDDDSFRIKDDYLKSRRFGSVKLALSYTKRGVVSYAVHGYAGCVGPDVIKKEIISKISRSREVGTIPREMERPKSLWRIDEGLLIVDGEGWLQQVLGHLGLSEDARIIRRSQEEPYEALKVYTLEDDKNKVKIAVKNFKDIRSLKWAFLNLWALPTKWFEMSPLTRLGREYAATRRLRELGLDTPQIISLVLNERMMVSRFIEGISLGKIVKDVIDGRSVDSSPISIYGKSIAHAHRHGYSLGDTKPSNAIVSDGKLFLTDLEQSTEHGDPAWDIALFVYYSNKLTMNVDGARIVTRTFLEGYLKSGDVSMVKKALNPDYMAPFQAIIAPNVLRAVRNEMSKAIA